MSPATPTLPLSAPSTLHICPTCTHKSLPLDVILPKEAWARVSNSQRLGQLEAVDDQLVIEDDCGNVIHTEGDLSFLMPSAPVLNQQFHTQLNADIQDDYRVRQRWVWNLLDETEEHPRLQVAGREVNFLKMFVNKETYTITAFTEGTATEKVAA